MPLPRRPFAVLLVMSVSCMGVRGEPVGPSGAPLGHDVLVSGPIQSCSPEVEPPGQDPATTSSLPGSDKFSASEHFREDVSPRSTVKISWLGATFKQRFVSRIEGVPARATLQAFRARRPARPAEIAAALGDRRETTLGELWCLLALQPDGESGLLLTAAIPNLFFVRDNGGVLWTVDVVWGGAGWEIGASSTDGDGQWPAGVQAIVHP
jgi:hypothetical protein